MKHAVCLAAVVAFCIPSLLAASFYTLHFYAGRIYVYNPSGKLIDVIEVPDRPIDLVFGGKDGNTLFILARSSLYAVETCSKGIHR